MLTIHDPAQAAGTPEQGDSPRRPGPTPSLLGRALVAWTRLCLWQPWVVVLVAVASAVASGVWTADRLG